MVILVDVFNVPEDIFEAIFATKQQMIVGKLLIDYLKANQGEVNKVQMSQFATALHEGSLIATLDDPAYKGKKVKLSYNKRQFYDRILTPMKAMGMIEYNLYRKVYRLSDRFHAGLLEIGLKWKRELEKPHKSMVILSSVRNGKG